jgi:hypothetical protein
VTEPAHLAQQSLSTEAARLLANTTKSAPQYIGSSHRWLVPFLPWRALEAGTFRINRLRVTAPPARLVAVVDQEPAYARIDAPADRAEKAVLGKLSPEQVTATGLAGEPITARMTSVPGDGASLGGLKVTTESGWFAAGPSGTEASTRSTRKASRDPST